MTTSGAGRLLSGSAVERVGRDRLMEFRGSLWEAVNDWYFGHTEVAYDWTDPADVNKLTKWIYTQDAAEVSAGTTGAGRLDIGLTAGSTTTSNQRELWTIPETGLWGIAHAQLRFEGERWTPAVSYRPQHGIGLRAQEDTRRRAVVIWHDVTFGVASQINIGVWQGNLDGSGFANRQMNGTLNGIRHDVAMSSASRVGGTVTFIATAPHQLQPGYWVSLVYTREFNSTPVTRAANVVTATVGSGHGFQAGDGITLKSSAPASFDGSFTLSSVTSTTVLWAQTGANESGTTSLSDQSNTVDVKVSEVLDATTFRYVDGKHDLANFGTAGTATGWFPYTIEVVLDGTVVYLRAWGSHQTRPAWNDYASSRVMVADIDLPHLDYAITASSRLGGVATVTIGAHDAMLGNKIDVVGITDTTFNTNNGLVTAKTATTVSYLNPGPDVGSAGTGTLTRSGGGTAATIADIPTPRGSGRIAVVAAHMGSLTDAHASYRLFFGENSTSSLAVTWDLDATGQTLSAGATDLTVDRGLAATGQVVTEGASSLTADRGLSSTGQVVTEGTADLTVDRGLATTGQVVTEGAATLTLAQAFSATGQVVTEGATDLTVDRGLATVGQVVSEGATDLVVDRALAATGQVVSEGVADLTLQGIVPLAATGQTVTEASSATLTLAQAFTATGQTVSEGAPDLTVDRGLTAVGQVVTDGPAELAVVDRGLAASSGAVVEALAATLGLAQALAATAGAVTEGTATATITRALAATDGLVVDGLADLTVVLAGFDQPHTLTLTASSPSSTLTASGPARTLAAVSGTLTLRAVDEED